MLLGLRTVIYHVPDLQRAKSWYCDAFGVQPLELTNTLKILQDIDKSSGRLYRVRTGGETSKLASMPNLQLVPPKCDGHLHGFDGFEELDCLGEGLPSDR